MKCGALAEHQDRETNTVWFSQLTEYSFDKLLEVYVKMNYIINTICYIDFSLHCNLLHSLKAVMGGIATYLCSLLFCKSIKTKS